MKTNWKSIRELDRIFSIYIRQKYADSNGYAECYTCGANLHWSKLQCGHYFSRRLYATRWNEDNCRPQCYKCNMILKGNLQVYTKNLFLELGEDKFNALYALSQSLYKIDYKDVGNKINHYKELI